MDLLRLRPRRRGFALAALAGLKGWYTAGPSWCFTDEAGTVAAGDGDPVRRWRDRGPGSRDLTQATTAARPTLRFAAGRWTVDFDGVDDWLSMPVIEGGATAAVQYLALRFAGATNNADAMRWNEVSGSDLYPYLGAIYVGFGTSVRKGPLAYGGSLEGLRTLEATGTAARHDVWFDGVSLSAVTGNALPEYRDPIQVGGRTGVAHANVKVAGLVVAEQAPSEGDRERIRATLAEAHP